jgi:hypothetical protein
LFYQYLLSVEHNILVGDPEGRKWDMLTYEQKEGSNLGRQAKTLKG